MKSKRLGILVALWIGLGAAAWGQEKPGGAAKDQATPPDAAKPAGGATTPALQITLDTSEVPEMADWAAKAKELSEKAYPMICEHLGAAGFKPPTHVKIIFKKTNAIAYTSGTTITCGDAWFKAHPDDYGAVIHEVCHVVQAFGRKRVPGWVTEGIADYVRWFVWEPANKRPRVRWPDRAKYTDSYQTTGAFFDWIVRTKDKTFVNRLNAACRRGEYKAELFQEFAGKPVDELWNEFIEAMKKDRPRRSKDGG